MIKKSLIIISLLFLFTKVFYAQTSVPGGLVYGTWDQAGSPYLIQGHIQVPGNYTLTIEPGVHVIFQGNYKLTIYGKVIAVGNQTDSVYFTAADTSSGWDGIKFISPSDPGPTLFSYCDIRHAKGNTYGGAFYIENYSYVVISNCHITRCEAGNGGAIALWPWSDPVIKNNLIDYNIAGADGGAIWCMGSGNNTNITGNKIVNNTANSGGAIFCYANGSPSITNNIIANNTAVLGGGIRVYNSSFPVIVNNTIVNNSAESGGGIYSDLISHPVVRNTIIWGNTASLNGQQVAIPDEADPGFYYCDIQGGQADFYLNGNSYFGNYQNNINSNPLFMSPSAGSGAGYYGGNADWSLQNTSPCIDAGDPAGNYPTLDMAGNNRISVCKIDMGALEKPKGNPLSISLAYSEPYLCLGGNNGTLTAVQGGGSGSTMSFLWNTGETTPAINITGEGVYAVTVTDVPSGCTIADSDTVVIHTFEINAGSEKKAYCTGSIIQLDSVTSNYSGQQNLTYNWQPPTGLNNNTIANPVATLSNPETYIVTVSTTNGCTAEDYVNVQLTPLTLDAGTASSYCGFDVQLKNITTNYETPASLTYHWSPSAGLNNDTIPNPMVSALDDKTYYLTVTTPDGCTATDSIFIDFMPLPLVSSQDDWINCGNQIQLKAAPGWVVKATDTYGSRWGLYFINTDTGFAVGYAGNINKTTNGGASWQSLNTPTSTNLMDITFINDTVGFIAGGMWGNMGEILKTTNGGNTWSKYITTTAHTLNAICFSTPTTGFAAGGDMTSHVILRTTNGGNTWTTLKSGIGFGINDITFVNATTGYAAGSNGQIIKTINGGLSWTTLTTNTSAYIADIFFVDSLLGFAAGETTLLKTVNGGNTWSAQTLGSPNGIRAIAFLDSLRGYITSDNQKIYFTRDGGTTWDEQPVNANALYDICFPDSETGYAIGDEKMAKISFPSDYQWSPSTGLSLSNIYNPVANPVTNTTYAVSATWPNGCIAYDTVNVYVQPLYFDLPPYCNITCGTYVNLSAPYISQPDTSLLSYQWLPSTGLNNDTILSPQASPDTTTIYQLTVSTENGCLASDFITVNVLPLTINANPPATINCGEKAYLFADAAWVTIGTLPSNLQNVFFTSRDTGYAISGNIYKTTNGGNSWTGLSWQSDPLRDIFFYDHNTGYAVGDWGVIAKTSDGTNWTHKGFGSTYLNSVHFPSADTGYVTGADGLIAKTENGGNSWTVQTSGITSALNCIYFPSVQTGFAVGSTGKILKTSDGGANWSVLASGTTETLNAVFFVSEQTGFVAGNGNTLLKTSDGGSTWQTLSINFPGNSIYFSDSLNGYIAGYLGVGRIAKTADGGNSWYIQNLSTYQLKSLQFPDPQTGYVLSGQNLLKHPALPDSILWTPSTGLSDSTIVNPVASPAVTTTYYVSTYSADCSATDSVTITFNPLSVDAGMNIYDTTHVCRVSLQLDSVATNYTGTAPLYYHWSPAANLDSDSIPNPFVDITSTTTFYVTVTDSLGCEGNDSIEVNVIPLNIDAGPALQLHCGEIVQLGSITTNYQGNDSLHYLWSPATGLSSDTIPNPFVSASNITYTLSVSNTDCAATDDISISITPYNPPQICVVGVDSTNRNIIVWEKGVFAGIDTFFVFRETNITGDYEMIAAVPYDSMSIYRDTLSNPVVQSNRYKLNLLDTCGFMTNYSPHHKTMHLTINQGMGNTWNLIWEAYEGFTVNTYNIYRGIHPEALQQIGSMAGTNTQYTDLTPPATGFVYYQVEIIGNMCNPSKSYNYSRSNIATNDPNSIYYSDKSKDVLHIFPNPAQSLIYIEPHSRIQSVNIYNTLGQLIKTQTEDFEKGIFIGELNKGVYFTEVLNKNGIQTGRFIKN